LGKSWGMKVSEKKISIDEVIDAHASGHLKEIFGSGTAAVISPVGELKYGETVITVGDGGVGPLAHKFFQAIQDIQYGVIEGPQGMGGAGLRKPLWKREALEASCPPLPPGILDPLNPYLQEFT
jgi:hypothetical protein